MMGRRVDIVVLGSGPAGHKAAIQGAKEGRSVLVVERAQVGGACVHQGTIPSKALREVALSVAGLERGRAAATVAPLRPDEIEVSALLAGVGDIITMHQRTMDAQLVRNGVSVLHGRARFRGPHELEVLRLGGDTQTVEAETVVIATGSRPRTPPEIPVDHEHILDSDTLLTMPYLPASLTVLGAGVIACEYASIFAVLGVQVTIVDRATRPLAFLDPDLSDSFLRAHEARGGRFLGGRRTVSVAWDGISQVVTTLDDGQVVRSEKMLCALGRVANVEGLDLAAAGLAPTERGLLAVDEHCLTSVAGVYAVGDVIGPPSLASSGMEQGRRAVRHALGLGTQGIPALVPAGIFTIPEMASVGLSEDEAKKRFGGAVVGRARFDEIARAQIAGQQGVLKLVADAEGKKLVGAQIAGHGATELIHVAQMALNAGADVDLLVDTLFNFPTLAEGYRIAAFEVVKGRTALAPPRAA